VYIHNIIKQSESILESIHDGIAVVDSEEKIIYVNEANYRITGIQASEFLGRKVNDIVPDSHIPQVLSTGSKLIGIKTRVNDKEVISNIVPFIYNGKVEGVISIFRDISEILRLNEKLEDAKSTIQHLYQELNFLTDADHNIVVGNNSAMLQTLKTAQKASQVNSTVLLQGESGTGKEVVARFIHKHGLRSAKPFITVNCAAIPESLLESELFGYEEGAFTGARKGGRPGMFELADKGTIFLDEIGDMNFHLQAKLLRVLQSHEIMRVGGTRLKQIDVRVIAATNKNLTKMVEESTFREDLYYRLAVIKIGIPSLRERKEDIHLYISNAVSKIGKRLGKDVSVTPRAIKVLTAYSYPGNIRELENIIELCLVSDEDRIIDLNDLPENVFQVKEAAKEIYFSFSDFPSMSEVEAMVLKKALEAYKSKAVVAKQLKMSRSTLYRKLKEYGFELEEAE
jgi:PAS domain S-box-containing protein